MWQSSSPGFSYPTALSSGTLPNKISCFVSICVSLDNSFLSVRQEPTFRPWKGSPFLQQHQNLKASILWCSAFFMVQLSHPYMTTGKTIALTIWTFVGKVMSLLFNMLSRLVIAFLSRGKCLSLPMETGAGDTQLHHLDSALKPKTFLGPS